MKRTVTSSQQQAKVKERTVGFELSKISFVENIGTNNDTACGEHHASARFGSCNFLKGIEKIKHIQLESSACN